MRPRIFVMPQIRKVLATLSAICLICSCNDRKNDAAPEKPVALAADDGVDASFKMAVGTWDFAHGDSTCIGNTHTISFTPDRQTMILTFNAPRDTTRASRLATYNVLSAGRGHFLDYPHTIRGAIDGETRRTATGDLVVWDLVIVTPNRYHWHRTDWPEDGMTGAVIRCDGTHPLEQWVPPPPPPPQFGPRAR